MSLYLLDTDTVTFVRNEHRELLEAIRKRRISGHEIGLTSVTIEEQMEGWFGAIRSAKTDERIELMSVALLHSINLWSTFRLVPLTSQALGTFQTIRRLKLNVGGRDLRIASIALTLDATVVTRNLRDFQRVPGLKVENWVTA